MPFSLIPDRVAACYAEITPDYLKERGITLLLSDLDFTLATKKTRRPDQPLRDWIAELNTGGIQFMIVSNNRSGTRVTEFCAELGVPYQGHAGKPSTRGLEAAMARAPLMADSKSDATAIRMLMATMTKGKGLNQDFAPMPFLYLMSMKPMQPAQAAYSLA